MIDKNGYIGEKRPNGNTVYFGYLDSFADFSDKGLGQVTIIPIVIGEVTIGGRKYKTTKIGNQEWLAENLDYKFDVNGSQIPIGVNGNPTTPAAWYYDNNEASYGIDGTYKCGLLYNWQAVQYLDDNKATLLPNGWHVPTFTEWSILSTVFGGNSISGMLMKATDNYITQDFPNNWKGIGYLNFNGLPTGRYNSIVQPVFKFIESDAYIWTGTQTSSTHARAVFLYYLNSEFTNESVDKAMGMSLRLVKDVT